MGAQRVLTGVLARWSPRTQPSPRTAPHTPSFTHRAPHAPPRPALRSRPRQTLVTNAWANYWAKVRHVLGPLHEEMLAALEGLELPPGESLSRPAPRLGSGV